jgi:hypothetical protein
MKKIIVLLIIVASSGYFTASASGEPENFTTEISSKVQQAQGWLRSLQVHPEKWSDFRKKVDGYQEMERKPRSFLPASQKEALQGAIFSLWMSVWHTEIDNDPIFKSILDREGSKVHLNESKAKADAGRKKALRDAAECSEEIAKGYPTTDDLLSALELIEIDISADRIPLKLPESSPAEEAALYRAEKGTEGASSEDADME